MEEAPDRRTVVVCDASVLINFLILNRLDLLSRNPDYRFVVTEHAIEEVTEPGQNAHLQAALKRGEIEQVDLTEPEGLLRYAELHTILGSGEAAAIALATQRNWVVATDDAQARREIESGLGSKRRLTTPGILLKAIRGGMLTIDAADEIKKKLESHRFKMSFRSFADLI